MELEAWAKKYCPQFLHTYERSKDSFESLKPGVRLLTLRSGYGGYGMDIREVVSDIIIDNNNNRYVKIRDKCGGDVTWGNGSIYLLYEFEGAPWYFSVRIFKENEFDSYSKLNSKEKDEWALEKVGKHFVAP